MSFLCRVLTCSMIAMENRPVEWQVRAISFSLNLMVRVSVHFTMYRLLCWYLLCAVDVHVDVGSGIIGQCFVVFLTSVSSAPTDGTVCCPHAQDGITSKTFYLSVEYSICSLYICIGWFFMPPPLLNTAGGVIFSCLFSIQDITGIEGLLPNLLIAHG